MYTNLNRIIKDIEALEAFNATPGQGVTRHCFTEEDKQAKAYIRAALEKIGVTIWEDGYGNLFGRLEGTDKDAPAIMAGSHYDSVTHGGKFDGPAGLIAGLEVLRVLKENKIALAHPIEFVAMNDEEGVRFGTGVSNSRAMTGKLTEAELDSKKDKDGISLRETMTAYGIDVDLQSAVRPKGSLKAFLELHIEQGPILEGQGKDIGLVDTIVGINRFDIHITGKAGHAGTTPMQPRQDALVAAADLVLFINNAAKETTDGTVATVGEISISPNASNVIPAFSKISVDLRSKNQSSLEKLSADIQHRIQAVEKERNVQIECNAGIYVAPVSMDADVMKELENQCRLLGFGYLIMDSGAGHDAMNMAAICPANMIFVPSKDGLSHHPDEWTDYEQLQKGIELMLHTIISIDKN